MEFNKEVFKQLQTGAGPQSPVPGIASGLAGDTSAIITSLEALDIPELTPMISDIEQSQASLSGFSSHAQDQLDNALQRSSLAQTAKQVDAFVDDQPPSCANTSNMMGTITGAANSVLSDIGSILGDISGAIASFIAGTLSESQLLALLSQLIGNLKSNTGWLDNTASSEQQLLQQILATLKELGQVLNIETLWQDPCGKAVMEQVLPNSIKDLL